MCGIAGVVGRQPTREILSAMAKAMVHRGPDDEGIFLSPEAGLAFRRLAIVDLESGHQPMTNEDGSIQLVFNGEIYDHHLLRLELQARGHQFVTDHSDTEVLVHGWEEWREQLFPKLNGMFGLAIWDSNTRELILARDRYGIKPLYYAPLADGGVVFASEIKGILASGLVANEPSHSGILEYFSFQNLLQKQTMFKGIYQLEPATFGIWKDGRMNFQQFWDLSFTRSRKNNVTELAAEHRELLGKAISRQVVADVPVKSYLSGGIDSTAITIAAHQVDPQVTAYSCIFDLEGVGSDKTVDEREYSRLVAEHYSLNRVELELPQDTLQRCIRDYVYCMEDLRMGVGYPVYMIAQRVAADAKVVLSGTGGDEFHAGYVGRFAALGLNNLSSPVFSWRRLLSRIKHSVKQTMLGARNPNGKTSTEDSYRNILNFMAKPDELDSVFTDNFMREANGFDAGEVLDEFLSACPAMIGETRSSMSTPRPTWRDSWPSKTKYRWPIRWKRACRCWTTNLSTLCSMSRLMPCATGKPARFFFANPCGLGFRSKSTTNQRWASVRPILRGIAQPCGHGLKKRYRRNNVLSAACSNRNMSNAS